MVDAGGYVGQMTPPLFHNLINNISGINTPFRFDTIYLGDISFDGWDVNDKK